MQTVKTVLHGGLGNQLFQLFVAQLEVRRAGVAQLHLYDDKLAQYSSARDLELEPLLRLPLNAHVRHSDTLARWRLPKLLWKLSGRERVWYVPGYGVLVDGYFQNPKLLSGYAAMDRDAVLAAWRDALRLRQLAARATRERVTHFRLGDFFATQDSALEAAKDRLDCLGEDTDVITDQEELVQSALARNPGKSNVRVVTTRGMSAWRVLHEFSKYRLVDTNGSSLAFWAATLSGAQFTSSNAEHAAAWRLLASASVLSR